MLTTFDPLAPNSIPYVPLEGTHVAGAARTLHQPEYVGARFGE